MALTPCSIHEPPTPESTPPLSRSIATRREAAAAAATAYNMGISQSSLFCAVAIRDHENNMLCITRNGHNVEEEEKHADRGGAAPRPFSFQMPLHYPRYTREDYEAMPEGTLDVLLASYGLPVTGGVDKKREDAMGNFLWPSSEGTRRKGNVAKRASGSCGGGGTGGNRRPSFQMPVHYPRYSRAEYDRMPEEVVDRLLTSYGLPATGSLEEKRAFAKGAFLWS